MSGQITRTLTQGMDVFSMPIVGIVFLIAFLSFDLHAQEQATDKKLDDVKKAIVSEQSSIKQTNQKRQQLLDQLKQDELAIASNAKKLNQLSGDLTASEQKLNQLAKEKVLLNKQKKRQETILADQLRAAYSSGHNDYLKLILNQQKPSTVQRTISYYQYLNTARIKEIENFKETIAQLTENERLQAVENEKLTVLKQQQQQQLTSLEQNKNQREKTVAVLSKELLSSQQLLEKLQQEEANLKEALERLARLRKQEFDLTGLKNYRNKLNWPVKGRVLRNFGSAKQGYLKWKGMLIDAPIGKTVTTVHNGVVLFSDWLKGYGLVTVIDHGEGYMSLYGHNQALLKSVGERVETGEPIALVGQSGGQSRPALYFEIRHNGKAANPKLWLR
ncbi:murein hydrolase activator EnvC family protein [Thalassotalea marina]|uniref:Non-catalytic member of peptidase subfamily M23B n=1 Tax=Thalassotalea marina TaxID=1673741 RepID=A0A919EJM0_9GAMM|nr:peptidoglycan DD-metalloendopeptidase family protein [Thalassotalea marina]GHF87317.1 non-catalytic member of peptidase subfamily M23B [Thalassotalea marina]